jgi:N-acetyl sugar amidotransferase
MPSDLKTEKRADYRIRYCRRCVMPDLRPDLHVDDGGVCNACHNFDSRQHMDWGQRRKQLDAILERHRGRNGNNYDCVVPVSGGKDSTFQVVNMLEMGMNPLCVMARTCDLTPIGQHNIQNLRKLGVDLLEFQINPLVRKKLGLTQVGDISWPEHVSIFTVPVRVAVQYRIPLLIWGENPQNEYGGPADAVKDNVLDRRWLEEFGGMLGLRVSDLEGIDGIEKKPA